MVRIDPRNDDAAIRSPGHITQAVNAGLAPGHILSLLCLHSDRQPSPPVSDVLTFSSAAFVSNAGNLDFGPVRVTKNGGLAVIVSWVLQVWPSIYIPR